MLAVEILETTCVYKNPKPHVVSRHAYFPSLCQLPGGDLVCGMDIGSAFESPDMRSYVCRSRDGGRSWSEPVLYCEPPIGPGAAGVSTTCRVGHIGGGVLLGWACFFERLDVQEGLTHPVHGGFCRTDFYTVRSEDGGYTWDLPRPVSLPVAWHHFETCSPPLKVAENRWLVFSSPWRTWEGQASPWGHNGVAFVSDDAGGSWSRMVTVFDRKAEGQSGFEQAMTRLSDGRLLAVAWVMDLERGKSLNNRIAFSQDDAMHFSPSLEIPVHGETCRLLSLKDNHVLAVYRRWDRPGLWSQIARVEGDRWHPVSDQLLWCGDLAPSGATEHPSHGIVAMSGLKFGSPAVLRLEGGEVLVVFWGMVGGVSSIHAIRMRVD